MALTAHDIADLSAELDQLSVSAIDEAAELARASAIVDRFEASAKAAGVSTDAMASAISTLADKAARAKVLEEAKRALDDLNGVKPPEPIDEVTAAMEKLQKQAHQSKVLEEAKGRLGMLEAPADHSAKAIEALGTKLEGSLSKLAPTSGALSTVTNALKALGPKGQAVALVLTALVAIIGGVAIALYGLAKAAVAVTQEKDALIETFGAIRGGAKGGAEALGELSALANELPNGRDKILAWGKALMIAGKQGEALKSSVRAIAASAALMRDGGAAAEGLLKRLAMMPKGAAVHLSKDFQAELRSAGIASEDLAKALGRPAEKLQFMAVRADKLGGILESALLRKGAAALENMSLTWDSISGKLSESWNSLFSDLGPAVRPLMVEIRNLFAEFGIGTTLQKGAKSALTAFLTSVIGLATRVTHAIHVGFLELQIGALKAYIFFAPLVQLMRAIWTNATVLRGIKILLTLLAAPLAILIGLFAAVAAGIIILGTIAAYAWGLVAGAAGAAAGFIAGLVDGIVSGAGQVVDSVKNLAKGALEAFTGFFQIKSPSRLMAEQGKHIAAGAAQGIDEGSGDAQEAMDGMMAPKGAAKPRGGKGGATKIVHVKEVNFYGRAEEFPSFREQADRWLEELASGGPEGEPA